MKEPIYSITRSFSKKLQVKQYEPEDFFSSHTYYWYDKMPSQEEIKKVSTLLWSDCVEEVTEAIKERLESISKEVNGEDAPY